MNKRFASALAVLSIFAIIASGCGSGSDSSAKDFAGGTGDKASETTVPPDIEVEDDAPEVDEPEFEDVEPEEPEIQADDDPNTVYRTALESIQDFWTDEYPGIYFNAFTLIPEERIISVDDGGDTGTELCQDQSVGFDILEDNAVAFDCPEGQMVAWDGGDDGLMGVTAEQFGPLASSAILAHEFGHVIQYQSGGQLGTPFSELQADCYAGAWVAHVVDSPPEGLEGFGDPAAVDATLSAMITLRDPVGYEAQEEGAHGNGFDRVRTFQDGYERGAEECASYDESPPTVTEIGFLDEEDANAGGNLPFEEIVPAASADLDNYYSILVEGYEPLGTIEATDLDEDTYNLLAGMSEEIGDGAPLVFMGLGWAQSLQELLGLNEGRDETGQLLQAVCISGDWMAHMFYDVEGDETFGNLTLSPGDLDEALLGLIEVSSASGDADPGSVFELLSAYRQGVLERVGSCGL